MKKLGFAGLSLGLCLAFALPVMAQPQSPAEIACNGKATKFYNETVKTLATFDDFVKDATCKDSMYRPDAFTMMIQQFAKVSNWKGTLDIATRYSTEFPNAKNESKIYMFSNGLTAASALGDIDKILEWGEKVLAVDPNDLNALVILVPTIPEKYAQQTDAAAKEKSLARALELAKKLLAMPKPAAVDEKTWQTLAAEPAHRVVGFVHLQKLEYVEAETEYEQAVKIEPQDQVAWYQYGVAATKITIAAQDLIAPAYAEVNANLTPGPERDAAVAKRDAVEKDHADKAKKAIEILVSAVALPGDAISKAARVTLESLWKQLHDNKLDGLDDQIKQRKTELGVKG